MSSFNFITVRLGKDSLPDIKKISLSEVGVLTNAFTINVRCTQIPDNYKPGDYAFIWLGSDNNKGMPTKWKQGFKAVGRVISIARGRGYNDTSETFIEIVYVFHDAINRLDILRCAPVAYYWCSSLPLIGIDDHANQTIRSMSNSTFSDLRAFFISLESVSNSFRDDIIKIEPEFVNYFDFRLPNPQKYPFAKNLNELDLDNSIKPLHYPYQQIFYGAPGTGKSHSVNEVTKLQPQENVFRTTFHPDSDYSTFVGCYKPSMTDKPVRNVAGDVVKKDGKEVFEKVITYSFCPQSFTKAYLRAWQTEEDVFLIIEEINRGNCAQIFGDLFQLLDREDDGFSEYPIKADNDLASYIAEHFSEYARTDIPESVKNGEELILPSNLYIWATMNTSDQSLFPIDSAFKRRWDWQYTPISDGKQGWKVEVNGIYYDWWDFLQKINEQIGSTTNSEDKKLGYYFCKATNGIINAETFVGKVIFYIWNDVFKDFAEEAGDLFKDVDGSLLSFNKFYTVGEDRKTLVVKEKVMLLLQNIGVMPVDYTTEEDTIEDEDGNTVSSSRRDYSKFSINGIGKFGKNKLASECMKKYIELHPDMPVEDVLANWRKLGNIVPHFVESKEEYEARTDNSKRSYGIPCGDSVIYVTHDGFGNNGKVFALIEAVNTMDWGITLSKVEE